MRKLSWIAGGLLAVFSVLIVAVAIDLLAFYALDIKYSGYRPDRFFQYSALTGHFHKPNAEGNWYRYYDGTKFKVRTNEYGFADSQRTINKTRPRIALIGDSVVEFWEVEEENRGQYVLEELLDGDYEVLGLGVRDFGTDQTYLLFESVGVHFSPDIVIYTFTINDVWDNANTESKPFFVLDPSTPDGLVLEGYPIAAQAPARDRGLIDEWKRRSIVHRKLTFGLRLVSARIGGAAQGPDHVPLDEHFELRPYKRDYDDEDSRRMEITTRLIGLLGDFCAERNMQFLVVEGLYKPVLDESARAHIVRVYGDIFDYEKVTLTLEDYCRGRGIEFLSLPRVMKSRNLSVSSLMHRDDTMHLNEAGIRFYAGAVAEKLRSLEWVGNK